VPSSAPPRGMGNVCDKRNPSLNGNSRRRLTVSQPGNDIADRRRAQEQDVSEKEELLRLLPGSRRVSIGGRECLDAFQATWDDKRVSLHGDRDALRTEDGSCIGFLCKKGKKPESPNQDDFFIIRSEELTLCGVMDGHGACGHDISLYVSESLPGLILRHACFDVEPLKALTEAFEHMHRHIKAISEMPFQGRKFDATLSGTTATVIGMKRGFLYCAAAGDSRAVVGRAAEGGKWKADDLVRDHKPDLADEQQRIVKSGGEVRKIPGDLVHRIFVREMHYPGLAMSRSLGDLEAHKVGCVATPEVVSMKITQDMKFVLVASDGVWEFITTQEAVDLVGKYGPSRVQAATEELCTEAYKRWLREEGDVVDDITAVVVWL